MTMPRARFTVRALMIAVAVVAIALGVELIRRRRAAYLLRAEEERGLEVFFARFVERDRLEIEKGEGEVRAYRDAAEARRRGITIGRRLMEGNWSAETYEGFARNAREYVEGVRSELPRDRALADLHRGLRKKYERAARYPWLPVEPDPPEPE